MLGAGERLFGATSQKTALRLIETRPVGTALVHVRYGVVRTAPEKR